MTTATRQLTKNVVGEQPRKVFATCGYCGGHCYGRTCQGHSDLPQLEHALFDHLESNEPDRATSTAARPGSSTKGA